jgi:hypothetical protein
MGHFASSNVIPASEKEASIRGRGDFRVARLHDGEVAERGAEDGSLLRASALPPCLGVVEDRSNGELTLG